jgi:hypothetical protein
LCPNQGGALKPTSDGRWAHIVCAQWVPETWIDGGDKFEPIEGIDQIQLDRFKINCQICKLKKGVCIQCIGGRCTFSMHPLCGYLHGLDMSVVADPRDPGKAQLHNLCPRHKALYEGKENALAGNKWAKTVHISSLPLGLRRSLDASDNGIKQLEMKAKQPKQETPIELDEDLLCQVCFNGSTEEGNEIIICDRCEVAVHQACYGVRIIPKGDWYCSPCRRRISRSCVLCPVEGGALKPTVDGDWAHLFCSLWLPEIKIKNIERMEPVSGIQDVLADRWKLKCNICNTTKGACIQCSFRDCVFSFHPMCGRNSGLRMEVNELKEFKSDEVEVAFVSYCPRHQHVIFDEKEYFRNYHRLEKRLSRSEYDGARRLKNTGSRNNRRISRWSAHPSSTNTPTLSESAAEETWEDASSYWKYLEPFFQTITKPYEDMLTLETDDRIALDPSFIVPPLGCRSKVLETSSTQTSDPVFLEMLRTNSFLSTRFRRPYEILELKPKPSFSDLMILLCNSKASSFVAASLRFLEEKSKTGDSDFVYDVLLPLIPFASGNSGWSQIDEQSISMLNDVQDRLYERILVNNQMMKRLCSKVEAQDHSLVAFQINEADALAIQKYDSVSRNQFIRRGFSQGLRDRDDQSEDIQNLLVCQICFDGNSDGSNVIVYCDKCNVGVHKYCYNIKEIPDDAWYCDVCAPHSGLNSFPKCRICFQTGGAMKQLETSGWIHVSCGLWGKWCDYNSGDKLQLYPASQAKETCALCAKDSQFLMKCSRKSCSVYLHGMCAWFEGLYFKCETRKEDWIVKVFCADHTPEPAGGFQRDQQHFKSLRAKYCIHSKNEIESIITNVEAPVPVQSVDDYYDTGRCAVCFKTGQSDNNISVKCSQCGIRVHQVCYGILESKAKLWLCNACKTLGDSNRSIACHLCPRLGGAFKSIAGGKWVHVACALAFEEIKFKKPLQLESLFGLSDMKKSRFSSECMYCKRKSGACVRCSDKKCSNHFHILCALFSGTSHVQFNLPVPAAESDQRCIAFCSEHTPLAAYRVSQIPDSLYRLAYLRQNLDKGRTILDLVRRREKLQRSVFHLDCEEIEHVLSPPQNYPENRKYDLAKLEASDGLAQIVFVPQSDRIRIRISSGSLPSYKKVENEVSAVEIDSDDELTEIETYESLSDVILEDGPVDLPTSSKRLQADHSDGEGSRTRKRFRHNSDDEFQYSDD